MNENKRRLFLFKNYVVLQNRNKSRISPHIFLNNKENIIKGIDLFMNNLREFKRLINMKNEKKLIKIMKDSKKIRIKIISSKQDVNLPDFGRR